MVEEEELEVEEGPTRNRQVAACTIDSCLGLGLAAASASPTASASASAEGTRLLVARPA